MLFHSNNVHNYERSAVLTISCIVIDMCFGIILLGEYEKMPKMANLLKSLR